MITFERFVSKSIYGGSYEMDNSYKILSDNAEIGVFHFPNRENSEIPLAEGDMFLEYIDIKRRGMSRDVLKSIFQNFSIKRIVAETNDDNKSFWVHMGAEVSSKYSDEVREMYNFTLTENSL